VSKKWWPRNLAAGTPSRLRSAAAGKGVLGSAPYSELASLLSGKGVFQSRLAGMLSQTFCLTPLCFVPGYKLVTSWRMARAPVALASPAVVSQL
jgi:hypothetical protein